MNEKIVEDIIKKVMTEILSGKCFDPTCSSDQTSIYPEDDTIPIELSARHVHLSREHIKELFGTELTMAKELSQPGQFLSGERLRLIGPNGVIDNVAVLGPAREESQVEISFTDARKLGVFVPVRASGDIEDTPGIILASRTGIAGLEKGLIVAARHIHMNLADSVRFGVKDREKVSFALDSVRPVILEDVIVRVNDDFKLAMHIDLDEGNAAGWKNGTIGRIIKSQRETDFEAGSR